MHANNYNITRIVLQVSDNLGVCDSTTPKELSFNKTGKNIVTNNLIIELTLLGM